jgi:hypothetical protein
VQTVDSDSGRGKPGRSAYARHQRIALFFAMNVCLCFSRAVVAQTPDSENGDSNQSWTATTDSKADNTNPTETFESHIQSGDRAVDVRSLQILGSNGSLNPYQDIETETVRVNATTVRTTTRTFVRDGNGAKILFQITKEERQSFPGGDSKVVRTTSSPDANGDLQVAQREVQET